MNRGTLLTAAAALFAVPTFAAERQLDFRGQKVTVNGLAEGDWEYVGGANGCDIILVLIAGGSG